jgi:alkylhydroperoxidase/carboxymuconolactone decarboxylase family protein YurZ
MDLKDLERMAKGNTRLIKKLEEIMKEYPDTVAVYFEDGTGITRDGEEFDFGKYSDE